MWEAKIIPRMTMKEIPTAVLWVQANSPNWSSVTPQKGCFRAKDLFSHWCQPLTLTSLSEPESHLDTDVAFLTCIYEVPALSSKSCCPSHVRILTFPIKNSLSFPFFFCHIPPNWRLTLNLEAEMTSQPILPLGFSGLGPFWPPHLTAAQIPGHPP